MATTSKPDKTWYYIVYRKPRGRTKQYRGDGLIDAPTKKAALEGIKERYSGISLKLTTIHVHHLKDLL